MKSYMIAFVVVLLGMHADGQTYCQLCADHTMCKYTATGALCVPLITSGVSAADQAAIVDAHNLKRNRVARGQETLGSAGTQPAAANMRKMVWDNELATVAQRWANQCNFGHDACRSVTRFGVGQNAYMSMSSSGSSSTPDWRSAVDAWYNEVSQFNKADISPYKFSSGTGHYTQVVWADSYTVGCGFAFFRTPSSTWYHKYYVCNYGPAGNMISGVMYSQGTACSRCPAGTRCDTAYPGLCTV